jgi:hypothetical protein
MKNYLIKYPVLLLIILIISCSKEDDEPVTYEDPAIGSWQYTQNGTIEVLGDDLEYYDAPYSIVSEITFELDGVYNYSLETSSTDEWLQNAIDSNPDYIPTYDFIASWTNTRDNVDIKNRYQSYHINTEGTQGSILELLFNSSFTEFEIFEEGSTDEPEIYVRQ